MSLRIGAALSTEPDAHEGAAAAASAAAEQLEGAPADLAVVFASGSHLAAPEAALEAVYDSLAPRALIGCGAGGVLAVGRELETGTAIAVWAGALDEGSAQTFQLEAGDSELAGLPEASQARAAILLADPASFLVDPALRQLQEQFPGLPVVGGIASARTGEGSGALLRDRDLVTGGAVGVLLEGVDVLPCVSQGAAPIGPELTITRAEANLILELAGVPAMQKLREVLTALGPRERELLAGGLLVGMVIDPGKPEYEQGDFLVRGVLGVDPGTGAIGVAANVHAGQVIRLHARDAESADRDLHEALALRVQALGDRAPAGALCFTCNGRGRGMFGSRDHDASALEQELRGAPAAGFFAAGEIGPVGGENFLHGFTATVAIFAP